jgi:flagellin
MHGKRLEHDVPAMYVTEDMTLRIAHNIDAAVVHRSLNSATSGVSTALQRLSSGLRINSAADDAAGLSISEKMRGQIRGLEQANRNIQDGMSMLATMDGALEQVSAILVRARTLAVQFNNDVLDFTQKGDIITELNSLSDEVARIASSTSFNGIGLLNATGAAATLTLQVGANSGDVIAISLSDMFGAANPVRPVSFFALPWLQADITGLDGDGQNIASLRGTIGAAQNRLEHALNSNQNAQENLMAAESRIRDVDIATEATVLSRQQILQQTSMALLAQANQSSQSVLQLLKFN